jgi:2-alkyl-3-oxoalkanoate reductase
MPRDHAIEGPVLITGVSGFVGGALGRYLREHSGANVTGLSRNPAREGACDSFIAHDLALPLPADLGRFDAIIHCAALASPWAPPAAYERSNILALATMLAFAVRTQPKRFIFVSSSAVHYAFADQQDINEETPWPRRPINNYAAAKRRGEAMVRQSALRWTIVRPRAVFGPGDTVVFPRILHAAKHGALPLLTRADARPARANLLYIENLCYFLARIVELDAGGVFLLANDERIETEALLREILTGLGLPPPTKRVPVWAALAAAGAMEIDSRWLHNWREPPATRFGVASLAFTKTFDLSRAIATLGAPPVSLQDGLARFIAWQKPRLA